jgi:hypothetical protein
VATQWSGAPHAVLGLDGVRGWGMVRRPERIACASWPWRTRRRVTRWPQSGAGSGAALQRSREGIFPLDSAEKVRRDRGCLQRRSVRRRQGWRGAESSGAERNTECLALTTSRAALEESPIVSAGWQALSSGRPASAEGGATRPILSHARPTKSCRRAGRRADWVSRPSTPHGPQR